MKQLILLISVIITALSAHPCTSAIIAAKATAAGRPLLWKNRDTSTIDNKVAYIPASEDGEMAYVALFNANDKKLEQAWIGMNDAGFAVMNTASYNLKNDKVAAKEMDREGYLMTIALKHCRTVDDFARLLDELPKPLGVEANFGVIDAKGDGAFFECNNYTYVRYDLADEPDGILVRTNYSHSGRKGEGYGQIRERNALHLLQPYRGQASLTPEVFTDGLSCSFYHDLYGKDMLQSGRTWIVDQDYIPRYTTTASVVIEGVKPQEEPSDGIGRQYVMWTALGYPPVAQVVPVYCTPDGVDPDLQGLEQNGTSAMCNQAKARKKLVFKAPDGNKSRYVNLPQLVNDKGTGMLTNFRRLNHQTYQRLRHDY